MHRHESNIDLTILFLLLVIIGATALIGAVPTQIYGHDLFFLLDNGWKIINGQRPHVDFYSPWGPVTFLMMGLGLSISHASADGIGYGNAIFGLIIALWCFLLSKGRLTNFLRLIFCVYITLLATAPYALGDWPFLSSHAMVYNRYGYALLGLAIIECFVKKDGKQHSCDEFIGGISTGVILALCLFLKANYFLILIPIIIVSLLFHRSSRTRILGISFGFSILTVAILTYLSLDIIAVLKSFWFAAGARSQTVRLSIIKIQILSQIPACLVVTSLYFLENYRANHIGSWFTHHNFFFFALFIFIIDFFLLLSNAQIDSMPLLGIAAIIIANDIIGERIRFNISFRRYVVLLALCAFLTLPQLFLDLMGLANGIYQKVFFSSDIKVKRFSAPNLSTLILYDNNREEKQYGNGRLYVDYVNDGVALLQRSCKASDRVLTMDMVNPFPYALKWQPPRGGIAAVAFNYTISEKFRPSFEDYFGDATVVLVPKHPAQISTFIDGFYELYMPAMLNRFRLYTESNWFRLYKRK
jgi:hypothetical protein